ncbi:hypothetical protein COOONC_15212 [Cooperia oncophora]
MLWHLRIKQEKLKRKANARVDYVADVLIKAVEELAVEFEITDRRQLSSSFRVREQRTAQACCSAVQGKHGQHPQGWGHDVECRCYDIGDGVPRRIREQCTCPVQSYALINAKVNALVRQGNDSALETLSMIAERMSILANEVNVPLRGIALIARPDVPLTGGRPQLERQEMYTRARIRKQMRRRSQSAETVQVNPEGHTILLTLFLGGPRPA